MSFKNVEDVYTLSAMQAGMLFHTISEPGSGVFVEQVVFTLAVALDKPALEQAWSVLSRRYEVLRTVFLWDGLDEPLQVVRQTSDIPFTFLDWRDLTQAEQQDRLARFLHEDRCRGFDLSIAPLMRVAVVQQDKQRFRCVWSFHHLLCDGWSASILLKELLSTYSSIQQGHTVDVASTFRFRDYVGWLGEQDLSAAKRYWQSTLAGFTRPTDVNPFRITAHQPEEGDPSHQQQRRTLSKELTKRLRSFAQQHRLTLNTVLHGAWAVLLARRAGEEDVVYGATVSGRPAELPGIEKAVGMFINTIPCRVRVAADRDLVPWLVELQTAQLQTRQYEYTPLASVQAWSDVGRGQPLFESILVFENYPEPMSEDSGLDVRDVEYFEQSNYPLALLVAPAEALELFIVHDTSRFDGATADRMLRHLECLLEAFVENAAHDSPNIELGRLSCLSDAERQQIAHWNRTAMPYHRDMCIHHMIAAQAKRTPDALAVESHDQNLTYQQLDVHADQLAQRLRWMGVGPNVPVPLILERSAAMVVGMLGVLKAGGAYVPLDPSYPREHIDSMVKDVDARVVITLRESAESIVAAGSQVVCIDETNAADSPPPLPSGARGGVHATGGSLPNQPFPGGASLEPSAENLAYIIYTSGSTGKPKGVRITHRNLVHSTTARRQYYSDPVGRYLLLSSSAFDSSVAGIFWTLCGGGTLVVPPTRIEQDMQRLLGLFERRQITHTLCLPSLYQLILEHASPAQLQSLTTLIVAGEACPATLVQQHHALLPATKLYNEYGPTEATVWSTVYQAKPIDAAGLVPIGKPIANMQAVVLDHHLQPAPVGVCGELFLAGDGLSAGYLNRPEDDTERFIELRIGEGLATGWYRTGDLACFRPDGNLMFLGRADRQVKIRGYRVELEEIEAVLRRHPSVADVAVVSRAAVTENGDRPSVASVTATSLYDRLAATETSTAVRLMSELESLSAEEVDALLSESTP